MSVFVLEFDSSFFSGGLNSIQFHFFREKKKTKRKKVLIEKVFWIIPIVMRVSVCVEFSARPKSEWSSIDLNHVNDVDV